MIFQWKNLKSTLKRNYSAISRVLSLWIRKFTQCLKCWWDFVCFLSENLRYFPLRRWWNWHLSWHMSFEKLSKLKYISLNICLFQIYFRTLPRLLPGAKISYFWQKCHILWKASWIYSQKKFIRGMKSEKKTILWTKRVDAETSITKVQEY